MIRVFLKQQKYRIYTEEKEKQIQSKRRKQTSNRSSIRRKAAFVMFFTPPYFTIRLAFEKFRGFLIAHYI